jgi:hypothetical protein
MNDHTLDQAVAVVDAILRQPAAFWTLRSLGVILLRFR